MTGVLLVAHGVVGTALVVISVLAVQTRAIERLRRLTTILLALVLLQTLLGDVLYPIYLREAKPTLLALHADSRSVADVFEIKEHLAFFSLVLVIGAFLVARRSDRVELSARVLVASAHATILLVAVLGLVVFSIKFA